MRRRLPGQAAPGAATYPSSPGAHLRGALAGLEVFPARPTNPDPLESRPPGKGWVATARAATYQELPGSPPESPLRVSLASPQGPRPDQEVEQSPLELPPLVPPASPRVPQPDQVPVKVRLALEPQGPGVLHGLPVRQESSAVLLPEAPNLGPPIALPGLSEKRDGNGSSELWQWRLECGFPPGKIWCRTLDTLPPYL
jgi:hypothetical protein